MANGKLEKVEHPILKHLLTILRRRETSGSEFRRILSETSKLLAFEVLRDLKTQQVSLTTPVQDGVGDVVTDNVVIASILRAGNGMLDGVLEVLPFARVGHIGIYRDRFIDNTVEYYFRMPSNVKGARVLLLDPLLASGATAVAAINRLKQYEVGSIHLLTILAAPEGVRAIQSEHPDVSIHCLGVEQGLNPEGLVAPGLGDAGDRLYGVS